METIDWKTRLPRQTILNGIMGTLKRSLHISGEAGLQKVKNVVVRFEQRIYNQATSQSDYMRKIARKMREMETKAENSQDTDPMDCTSLAGNTIEGDCQEEVFLKIKSMNKMYHSGLNDIWERTSAKLQEYDSLPQQQRRDEQADTLRHFKFRLEQLILYVQTSKNDIRPSHKVKIVAVEREIVNILNSVRPRKPVSALQPGHALQSQMHTVQHPHMTDMHGQENQMSSQIQDMSTQGNLSNLDHNSHQENMDTLQPSSNINPGQGNGINWIQHVATNSMQQNLISGQMNMNLVLAGNTIDGDWRTQLPPDLRQKLINKMVDTLKRCLYISGEGGLQKLKTIAVRFEERIFSEATSQSDYLRKISSKMRMMVTKSWYPIAKSLLPSHARNTQDTDPMDCTSLAGNTIEDDWQEKAYQNWQEEVQTIPKTHMTQMHGQVNQMSLQMTNLQHNSRQDNIDPLQPGSNINPGQGNGMNSIQHVATNSMQQKLISGQMNMNLVLSDSSSLAGNTIGGDWQEEIFQKIKSLNEMYYSDLNDLYLRMAAKFQKPDSLPPEQPRNVQHDSLSLQQPINKQFDKVRHLKLTLEKLIMFIRTSKNDIQPSHKQKMLAVEKQIVYILNSNQPRKLVPALQPGQQAPQSQMHTVQLPHMTDMHGQENQMGLHIQQISTQGNMTNLDHNSRQNNMDILQPGSNVDLSQGNRMMSIHQVATNPMQQNPDSGQMNMDFPLAGKSVDLGLLANIQQLTQRSKTALTKNQLEKILRDLYLHLNPCHSLRSNQLILQASDAISKLITDIDDSELKMEFKDAEKIISVVRTQIWMGLVNLYRNLSV